MEFDFTMKCTVRFDDDDPKRCAKNNGCGGYLPSEDEYDTCLYFDDAYLERPGIDDDVGLRCQACLDEEARQKKVGIEMRPNSERRRT